ncbi:MAG: hypothetical protein CML50_00720 [Rhodobacteraceae bacterium]|uniref:GpW protein n=1 Tax=Salipiger profundus TaxID=1229727 RepID=A0A1U7D0T8_9RHOB|nr:MULTISPECIES: gpW family head-tail joining protein [Salipiger]APX21713.1 gpW protein [Salipiger profundus]MAB04529.1 hypothetical protein [Paracoccaceae bacterium]GGA00505.1 hypothetical protein GCM10011326_09400 [Salipiger profundus]
MADTATLEARLEDAEEALHAVLMGESVTVVAYDGHRTEYGPANEAGLRRYIASLKRQLGQGGVRGSRRVIF